MVLNNLKLFYFKHLSGRRIRYVFLFGFVFLIFLYVIMPAGFLCPDGFYHTKMALMIKEQGLVKDFPWLYFTTYRNLFVDHHLGYHLLLIPFLSLPSPSGLDNFGVEIEPLLKAKIATVFFASLVFVFIYWFCCRLKIRRPLFWALLPIVIYPFVARLSLTRAPAISIIIQVLVFYFILKEHFWGIFLLSFFYVLFYGAWPLMIIIIFLYCLAGAAQKLSADWNDLFQNQSLTKIKRITVELKTLIKHFFTKTNLKIILFGAGGLLAGLIINPYYPKTFDFYWLQTIKIALVNYHDKIGVGAEWYPPTVQTFYVSNLPVLILWAVSLGCFISLLKQQKKQTWFFALVSLFFLAYTAKAQRNIEYFVPTAIFFSGLILSQLKPINWTKVKNKLKEIFLTSPESASYFTLSVIFLIIVLFFVGFYVNFGLTNLRKNYKSNSLSLNYLQKASFWLKNNSQPNEIIFQSEWDIFPPLFYFNTKNYYINGLDQTFMYEFDQDLYWKWFNLVNAKTPPDKTAEILKQKFQASYVLATTRNKNFKRLLERSPGLEKVYEDEEAKIYKIK